MILAKRHIAKSITYRLLGTTTTVILSYSAGLTIQWASYIGIAELLIKPLIYFIHERIWYKWIKYGVKNNDGK